MCYHFDMVERYPPLSEKQQIEAATAEGFLHLYNSQAGTTFRVVQLGDSPDVVCEDAAGRRLNLEITLTDDRPRDIQAALGRSDHRSFEALRQHLQDVRQGKANPLDRTSALSGNVAASVISRLQAKLNNRYGPDTALVIRDSSGVDWDWDLEVPRIRAAVASQPNPFSEGVWILNRPKDRLFRVL